MHHKLGELGRLQPCIHQRRNGRQSLQCQKRNAMFHKVGKDGCNPAAGLDAARRKPSRDHVDLCQKLPVSQLAVGAVVHQCEVIRRALAGDPDEVICRLHRPASSRRMASYQLGNVTCGLLLFCSPDRNLASVFWKCGCLTVFMTFWISNSVASSMDCRQPMWKPAFAIPCRWVGPAASSRAMMSTFLSKLASS